MAMVWCASVGAYDFDAAGLLQQADGRLVVTGSCWPNTDPNVKRSFCAARLTGSGSFDATFSNNSGSIGTGRVAYAVGAIEANVSAAALQPDGRVLIGVVRSCPTAPVISRWCD